jgi:hypothetical protein
MGRIVALTGSRALPDKLCSGHAFRDDADHFKTSVLDDFSMPTPRPAWPGWRDMKGISHVVKVARRARSL